MGQQLVCRGQEDGSPPTCSTMAARRISKSAMDWVAFAERIPGNQKETFRALKQKSDEFMARVHQNPEAMANIDFAFYRQRLANPAIVDEMEKGFKALSIPYPKDPDNIKQTVDKREEEAGVSMKTDAAKLRAYIAECEDVVKTLDSLPPLNQITMETYLEFFPDTHENLQESFFPHTPDFQPNMDKVSYRSNLCIVSRPMPTRPGSISLVCQKRLSGSGIPSLRKGRLIWRRFLRGTNKTACRKTFTEGVLIPVSNQTQECLRGSLTQELGVC